MVPLYSQQISRVRWYSFMLLFETFRIQDLYLLWLSFPAYSTKFLKAYANLGCFQFARRYYENRVFFLFLRVLRCFSSPGFPPYSYVLTIQCMILHHTGFPIRTPTYQRLLQLLVVFGCFRPSSALCAKAFTLRSFLFDQKYFFII